MKIKYLILLGLISGCASTTSWTPTVDVYNSRNNANLQNDMIICKDLAQRTTSGDMIAKDTITGTLGGAAAGALGGWALSGNPGIGSAIGAISGTAIMGGRAAINSDNAYKQAYINCMRNRGHNVID